MARAGAHLVPGRARGRVVIADIPQSLPRGGAESLLEEARARTLRLVDGVSGDDLDRVHDPLMSPLAWDLGHIAAFEDLWVSREAGSELMREDLATVYDAFETPRAGRGELRYLRHDELPGYLETVRDRTRRALDDVSPFIAEMLIQHEHQHNETMLQTLQLAEPGVYSPELTPAHGPAASGGRLVEAGSFELGDAGDGFAYDNERPRHLLELPAFRIDSGPVTNGAYAEFVADGGYARRELWSDDGWAQRESEGWERPLYWTADGGVRRFDRFVELEPELPVMHVSFHEAEAFARWRGARLPSEAEWERAALDEDGSHGRLEQLDFGPGPAGPFVGDCWEWTATEFDGYPGFRPHPYPEYSQVFFRSGYRVLRGASWATRSRVARTTFRNWDLPERRQIFAGFRCAEDA